MSSSSSDNGAPVFALLNGDVSGTPDVVASFRVGDNSMRPEGLPEFMVSDAAGATAGRASAGHITWDPSYGATEGGDFLSVAPVRMHLDVVAGQVRWSVGTTDFISCDCKRFRRITKLQVLATATDVLDGLVQWDVLRVSFQRPHGIVQSHTSPCLPRASSRSGVRRSSADDGAASRSGVRQQYAEIVGPDDAVGIGLMGQVMLHVRGGNARSARLSADCLQGKVLIFGE